MRRLGHVSPCAATRTIDAVFYGTRDRPGLSSLLLLLLLLLLVLILVLVLLVLLVLLPLPLLLNATGICDIQARKRICQDFRSCDKDAGFRHVVYLLVEPVEERS